MGHITKLLKLTYLETGEIHYCPYCPKAFKIKRGLDGHLRIHRATQPLECDVCGETFKKLRLLEDHKRIHRKKIHQNHFNTISSLFKINRMSVCLYQRIWTDMVNLYSEAFYRPWEGLALFLVRIPSSPME